MPQIVCLGAICTFSFLLSNILQQPASLFLVIIYTTHFKLFTAHLTCRQPSWACRFLSSYSLLVTRVLVCYLDPISDYFLVMWIAVGNFPSTQPLFMFYFKKRKNGERDRKALGVNDLIASSIKISV